MADLSKKSKLEEILGPETIEEWANGTVPFEIELADAKQIGSLREAFATINVDGLGKVELAKIMTDTGFYIGTQFPHPEDPTRSQRRPYRWHLHLWPLAYQREG